VAAVRPVRRRTSRRGDRRRALALAAPLLACPARAAAQTDPPGPMSFAASHSPGAAACPDAASFGARVRALRPGQAPGARKVDVHFDREGDLYVATVRVAGEPPRTRVLRAPGPGCEGLADAAAVSVALLLDATPEPPAARPPPPAPARPSTPRPRRWGAWLGAGGGYARHVPAGDGALLKLEALAAPAPRVVVGLGGAWAPARSIERGEGRVDVGLAFAFARGCWAPVATKGVRAAACAVPAVGSLGGRGRGYAVERSANRPWYALGGSLLARPARGPRRLAGRRYGPRAPRPRIVLRRRARRRFSDRTGRAGDVGLVDGPNLLMTRAASPQKAMPGPPAPTRRMDFRQFYADHADFVWRSLRRLGVREADAADAAQEVFLVAHRRFRESNTSAKPTTWLFQTCLHVAQNRRRLSHVRREVLDDDAVSRRPDEGPPSAEEALERREGLALLESALDRMNLEQRAVFVLFELEGLEGGDIAETLGVPLGTVYSRLRLGREAFFRACRRLRPEALGATLVRGEP
jgi:RNA polymerase sigma-70 factor (ECF subfamily)